MEEIKINKEMNNYEKAKEEGIKLFDEQFGVGVRDEDGDLFESESGSRDAGCDDCRTNLEEREEHRNFLSSFAEKIKEGVVGDLELYLIHEPRCDNRLKGEACDCGLDKIIKKNEI